MLVCHCYALNERRIRDAIAAGARSDLDVMRACGAGTDCGGCLPTVNRLLDECLGCPLAPAGISLVDVGVAAAVG